MCSDHNASWAFLCVLMFLHFCCFLHCCVIVYDSAARPGGCIQPPHPSQINCPAEPLDLQWSPVLTGLWPLCQGSEQGRQPAASTVPLQGVVWDLCNGKCRVPGQDVEYPTTPTPTPLLIIQAQRLGEGASGDDTSFFWHLDHSFLRWSPGL